ncbi:MAG: hypothetical protein AAF494_01375 [Pseudomonadota bacterium]
MASAQPSSRLNPGASTPPAERVSLGLRPAKLVCQNGEYICLMRQVSALGISLAFLHDVPSEPRIILQLASGETFPIERIWLGKRQAGYRFAGTVSIDEFTAESPYGPQPLRLKLNASGSLTDGRVTSAVELCEISRDAVTIVSAKRHLQARMMRFEAEGLAPQLGEIGWQDGNRFGFAFQHAISLEELAACAAHLQPLGEPLPRGFAGLLTAVRAA